MMARLQSINNYSDVGPSYDSDFVNENVQLEAEKMNKIIKVVKDETDLLKIELAKYAMVQENMDVEAKRHENWTSKRLASVHSVGIVHISASIGTYKLRENSSRRVYNHDVGLLALNRRYPATQLALSDFCNFGDKKVHVVVRDYDDALKNAEKIRLKMKEKQTKEEVPKMKIKIINYTSLNDLYEKFVPQKVISQEQAYISKTSTYNVTSEKPNVQKSSSPPPKMPKHSQMKRYFDTLDYDVKRFESVFKEKLTVNGSNFASGLEYEIQIFFQNEVKPINDHLRLCVDGFQKEFTKEVKEMYESYESMEKELAETSKENDNFNEKYNRLLETSLANDVMNCVVHSCVDIDNEILREDIERISKESKDIQESLLKRIVILEHDF
ncbi:hypothetical protein Tco_1074714 [Tanacetum coccineum]